MYNRNHVYEPGEWFWLLLRRDVSSTKNKQTVNKPLSHVSQTHVNYTRCFSCDISPKNDVLKSRSLRRRTCILLFFVLFVFICYVLLVIVARFLALVTAMVTKVDHGNYSWLPRLVTMVSYLGYQGANYGY